MHMGFKGVTIPSLGGIYHKAIWSLRPNLSGPPSPGHIGKLKDAANREVFPATWRSRVAIKDPHIVYMLYGKEYMVYSIWYVLPEVQESSNQAIRVVITHLIISHFCRGGQVIIGL